MTVAERYELTEGERTWLATRRDRVTLVRLVDREDYALADQLMGQLRSLMRQEGVS